MDRKTNGQKDKWTERQMSRKTNEQKTNGQKDTWTERQMDRKTTVQKDGHTVSGIDRETYRQLERLTHGQTEKQT